PHQTDRIACEDPLQNRPSAAFEAFLDRRTGRRIGLEPGDVGGNTPHHHGGEKRLLSRKAAVDRRLSRPCGIGDFSNARPFESALQKNLAGGIEDPLLNGACKLLWRAAKTHSGSPPRAPVGHYPLL